MHNNITNRRSKLSGSGKPVLTAPMFLGKNGNTAYVTGPTLLDFMDNGRVEDIKQMDSSFDMFNKGVKFNLPLQNGTDRAGNPYKQLDFFKSMGTASRKVRLIGDIEKFITDFHEGLFTINFTLSDLVAEAEQA